MLLWRVEYLSSNDMTAGWAHDRGEGMVEMSGVLLWREVMLVSVSGLMF